MSTIIASLWGFDLKGGVRARVVVIFEGGTVVPSPRHHLHQRVAPLERVRWRGRRTLRLTAVLAATTLDTGRGGEREALEFRVTV